MAKAKTEAAYLLARDVAGVIVVLTASKGR